jgi:hypothetical protein
MLKQTLIATALVISTFGAFAQAPATAATPANAAAPAATAVAAKPADAAKAKHVVKKVKHAPKKDAKLVKPEVPAKQ